MCELLVWKCRGVILQEVDTVVKRSPTYFGICLRKPRFLLFLESLSMPVLWKRVLDVAFRRDVDLAEVTPLCPPSWSINGGVYHSCIAFSAETLHFKGLSFPLLLLHHLLRLPFYWAARALTTDQILSASGRYPTTTPITPVPALLIGCKLCSRRHPLPPTRNLLPLAFVLKDLEMYDHSLVGLLLLQYWRGSASASVCCYLRLAFRGVLPLPQ